MEVFLDQFAKSLDPLLSLIARVLMATLFFMAAASNMFDLQGFAAFLEAGGVPGILAGPVFYFQVIGAAGLILGLQARLIGLAFAGFCLSSGLMYYDDYSDPMQVTCLLKNVALTGGFLFVFLHGPGAWSLDARAAAHTKG